jgi:hypothetical protein
MPSTGLLLRPHSTHVECWVARAWSPTYLTLRLFGIGLHSGSTLSPVFLTVSTPTQLSLHHPPFFLIIRQPIIYLNISSPIFAKFLGARSTSVSQYYLLTTLLTRLQETLHVCCITYWTHFMTIHAMYDYEQWNLFLAECFCVIVCIGLSVSRVKTNDE